MLTAPGADRVYLIKKDKKTDKTPAERPKIRYIIPIFLWLVLQNQDLKIVMYTNRKQQQKTL